MSMKMKLAAGGTAINTDVDSKTNVVNQVQKQLEKAEEGISSDILVSLADSPYVREIDMDKGRIYYTGEFYIQLNKLLEKGMKAADACRELGFEIGLLGEDRIMSCCARARKKASEMKNRGPRPEDFDGSIPEEEMKEKLTPEEQIAYLRARVMYLEALDELKKTCRRS